MAYLLFVSGISDDNRIQTESSFSTSIISQEDILYSIVHFYNEASLEEKNKRGTKTNEFIGDRLDVIVEESLRAAAIWDELKDRLKKNALGLSGGQQQRLCIARALAVQPEVLLLDESTSALDPISTAKIEELIGQLKERYTVIMVTHNMLQALRISDKTAFFLLGEVVEAGDTDTIFSAPIDPRTADYVAGRFG